MSAWTAVDVVDWKLIGTCNLLCLHCYGPPKTERALPSQALFALIEKFKELQAEWVVLTGGEPLLVPSIDDVMQKLVSSGMKVALSTNTSFFRRHQRVIEECVSSLNIPLDGSTPKIHALSRQDEETYHTFFDVLHHYLGNPDAKPRVLRVGTVYSRANHGDFPQMARVLEPFASVIDTWKIYELIDYEFQPELRQPILHNHDDFEREMRALIAGTCLAPKIMLSPAAARDKAYFMVNPRAHVVVPTDLNGVTIEVVVGNLLSMPSTEVIARWQTQIDLTNYYGNHRLHYDKTRAP